MPDFVSNDFFTFFVVTYYGLIIIEAHALIIMQILFLAISDIVLRMEVFLNPAHFMLMPQIEQENHNDTAD